MQVINLNDYRKEGAAAVRPSPSVAPRDPYLAEFIAPEEARAAIATDEAFHRDNPARKPRAPRPACYTKAAHMLRSALISTATVAVLVLTMAGLTRDDKPPRLNR